MLWASGFTTTSATLFSLTGDRYVVVRAVVGGVESPNSNEVLASADDSVPTAPANLDVTGGSSSFVGLQCEPVPGGCEYRAYVSNTSGSGYMLWASGFTTTSATLFSLTGDRYEIGRASCRGRVSLSAVAASLKTDSTVTTAAATSDLAVLPTPNLASLG